MNSTEPDSLPPTKRVGLGRPRKLLVGLVIIPASLVGLFGILRLFGLVQPFYVPNQSMTPAVSAGDHVMMDGMTFLARKPHRGDIAVFKTDGIPSLPPDTLYIKRIVGEPGEHLRISEGKIYINDKLVSLSNSAGEISYNLPPIMEASARNMDMTIPAGDYFVLGDNSTNSLDSRFFGTVPNKNIIGRLWFCCWPPQRIAGIK